MVLGLGYFLLEAVAVEEELGVFALEVLDAVLELLVLVHALFEVAQERHVAEQATVLLEFHVVHAQRVARLLHLVQAVAILYISKKRYNKILTHCIQIVK